MRYLIVGFLALLTATGSMSIAAARDALNYDGRISPGVAIAGVNVGGMTPQEAVSRVADAWPTRTLVLGVTGARVPLSLDQLGVRAHVSDAVAEAYALGHKGPAWSRWLGRLRLARAPVNVPLHYSHLDRATDSPLTVVAERIAVEPQDAEVTVLDGAVIMTRPSQEGRALSVWATIDRIVTAMNAGAYEADAVVQALVPKFTTQDTQAISGPVASFTTMLAPIANRTHNVALAAESIRGRVLAPGESFSYNRIIGPTTAARGFREAPVLINDELVPGEGGGVCQVSSTLFNVALLADLQILAHTNHSRPVPYLPVGRDATVNSGALDLRFRNTTGHHLLLWASVSGRSLTITAYGTPVAGKEISIVVSEPEHLAPPPETVTQPDPKLDAGQVVTREAQPGYRVKTYRIVKVDGQVVRRELIGTSYYRPVPRTIKIGTKRPDQTSARS